VCCIKVGFLTLQCYLFRPFDDKNPVVVGRLGHDTNKPTVCFYGHYVSDQRLMCSRNCGLAYVHVLELESGAGTP
jgi:hypothetical protein